MPKLTDTQLVILSAAAQRQDKAVLPLPRSLKVHRAAATTVLKSLLKKGLVAERPAAADEPHRRETRDGGRRALVITNTGLQAIGVGVDEKISKESPSTKPPPKQRSRRVARKSSGARPKGRASPAAARPGTKQALLIDLLKRKKGATIDEAVEAVGWQPHSVRGAISGTLKKKLGLMVISEKPGDGPRRYPVLDLVICHGSFLNADNEYVHQNKSFRGFGSYGDILVRDRKMYVAPTPFSLAEGTAHHFTLILPADAAIDDDLIEVGYLVRKEVDKVVVAYSFDLRTNEMATKLIDNPNAGCEHHFKAYRMNGDPPDRVQLQERSRLKFEATLLGNEKEGGNDE